MADFLVKLRDEKRRESTPNQKEGVSQESQTNDEVSLNERTQLGITVAGSILILLYALFVLATS